jgi:hypothetical protein
MLELSIDDAATATAYQSRTNADWIRNGRPSPIDMWDGESVPNVWLLATLKSKLIGVSCPLSQRFFLRQDDASAMEKGPKETKSQNKTPLVARVSLEGKLKRAKTEPS